MEEKQLYLAPTIERIELDNLISLALESTPPEGPNESVQQGFGFTKNNPFKITSA